ncbi:MAG: hypothetical protein ACOCXZ_03570 [Chloroflexota bacterium]
MGPGDAVTIEVDGRPAAVTYKVGRYGPVYGFTVGRQAAMIYRRDDADRTRLVLSINGRQIAAQAQAQATPAPRPGQEIGALFDRANAAVQARRARRLSLRQMMPDWGWFFVLSLLFIPAIGELHGLTWVLTTVGLAGLLLVVNLGGLGYARRVYLASFVTLIVWAAYLTMASRLIVPCRIISF